MIGDPPGYHRVHPLPDQEPVDFEWSKAVRATWITDDLIADLLEDQ